MNVLSFTSEGMFENERKCMKIKNLDLGAQGYFKYKKIIYVYFISEKEQY